MNMKTTDCSECHRVLFYGEDDMGDDLENPLCDECQESLCELDQYRIEEDRFDFTDIKRYVGFVKNRNGYLR